MQRSMWKRIFLPTLIALAILFGSHFLGEVLFSIDSLEKPAYVTEAPPNGDKPEDDVGAAGGDAQRRAACGGLAAKATALRPTELSS